MRRGDWVLVGAGVNLTLLNFILVQAFGIAFRAPELAVLTFSLSYFGGLSLGYFFSDRLPRTVAALLLPAMMPVQMAVIVGLQAGAYLVYRDVSMAAEIHQWSADPGWLTAYVVAFGLIMLSSTSVYAIILPAMIESERDRFQSLYSMEIAGSILGLLLVPALLSVSHLVLIACYFLVYIAIAVLLKVNKSIVAMMALGVVAFVAGAPGWDARLSTWFYQQWYPGKNVESVIYSRYTPYHKIEVLKLADGTPMLTLNGKRQFAHAGHYNYSYFLAEYPARLLGHPSVNLLGCGVMSTVGRMGDFVRDITIVDIDREVFETSRRYFQRYNRLDSLHNWRFVEDDAKHFIANTDQRFDLILHDIPPAYSRQIALTYTREFFTMVKARLADQGIFSMASLSPIDSDSHYGKRLIATLTQSFDQYFVLVKGSSVYFYGGKASLNIPDKRRLRAAIHHKARDRIDIYVNQEVDELVKGARIITIANVGDLIFDD
ncbi:MAG TPA: hypothetical protein ENK26_00145 [Gammaproteobacteria bacterium]|nr:hypothetical protein [Gammaproteobacteria bacterium]